QLYRNLGNFYFQDGTTNSGLPLRLDGAEQVIVEDWNNEDLPGIFATRQGKAPVYFAKQRAGSFVETNTTADWPAGNIMTSGDLNNDLRPDMAVAGANEITISFGGTKESARVPLNGMHPQSLMLVDYDN